MFTQLSRPSWSQGFARSASESAFPGLWTGLVGAWVPSLGPTDGTLRDVSGKNHDGVFVGMDPATDWVIGRNGYALNFDGVDGVVKTFQADSTLFAGDYSISTWLKMPAGGPATDFYCGKGNVESATVHMFTRATNDRVEMRVNSAGSGDSTLSNDDVLMADTWHHIVGLRRGSTPFIYVDGIDETASAGPTAGEDGSSAAQFWIGDTQHAEGIIPWTGPLDAFLLYDRALTSNEIQQFYVDSLAQFRRRRRFPFKPPVAEDITHVAATAIEPLGLVTLPPSVTSY